MGILLQEQMSYQVPFPPLPYQHKHTATCGDQYGIDTHYLTYIDHAFLPPCFGVFALPSHICLSPKAEGLLPQKTGGNITSTMSLTCTICRALDSEAVVTGNILQKGQHIIW